MSVERRGQVMRVPITLVNWQQEEPTDRGEGRQLFMDDTSRVSREAQARFCERLGVRFPGATRPNTRVVKFDKNGKFLMTWGTPGTGPSQFDTVHSIAIDKNRRLYVA